MKRLLKGGIVVDPSRGIHRASDVLIDGDRVDRVDEDIAIEPGIDVVELPRGALVCPGFIDMHVHLREPGQEHKETIETGARAAAAGGFTAVAAMPNTVPVNDSSSVTRFVLDRAAKAAVRVYPVGAVTVGSAGERLAEMADLKAAGCVAFSDDGKPVASSLIMRRALEYAAMLGLPLIEHCEDPQLKAEGVAHEGYTGSQLGLRGIPSASEEVAVSRAVILAAMTGGRVHVAHASTAGTVRTVSEARSRGIGVTCEVTPHHFTLTDECLAAPIAYDTNLKMNPPLRGHADRQALLAALADGTVDAIATDHAPHHADEKNVEFDLAPFGIVGLETAVSLALDRLVHTGIIGIARLVELMSVNPARILGVPGGSLAPGAAADLTLLSPGTTVTVDVSSFRSLSRNSPFNGWTLKGAVLGTVRGGRTIYVNPAVHGSGVLSGDARVPSP